VIKYVPPGFELHLELGERERPRAEGLHEPALEIAEPQQSARVLRNGKLAAEQAQIAREAIGKSSPPLGGRFVLVAEVDIGDFGSSGISVSVG
jgi:hypothetical protein